MAKTRNIIKKSDPHHTNYNIFMWAHHEIEHETNPKTEPYGWMPEEAAESKTPLAFARKFMGDVYVGLIQIER